MDCKGQFVPKRTDLESTMKDLAGTLAMLKSYEGNYSYMYSDSRGYVTVGVGFLLNTASDATRFRFWKRNDKGLAIEATSDEIKQEWSNIHSKPARHKASYYRQFTTMWMADTDINAELQKIVGQFEAQAKDMFSDWDKFPIPAQLALLDMLYNLGSLSAFPQLVESAKQHDWEACAKECHRSGPSPQRNSGTRNRFVQAAKEEPLSPPHQDKVAEAQTHPVRRLAQHPAAGPTQAMRPVTP